MIEAEVYKLENGKEYIVMASIVYKNNRFLLLNEEKSNEYIIAYEENNKLKIINEIYENYDEIKYKLSEKLKRNLNNCPNLEVK